MQKQSKFMVGAIVGSTIGAITTLLFSTEEGKKIQKKLMKKFHEMDKKTGHFGANKFMTAAKKTVHRRKPRRRKSKTQ
jgi:gas vesicle protein